jgi:hypothetical protein
MSNPDRVVSLDLSAIEGARGPQPNDFFICITREEAMIAAIGLADSLENQHCNERECDACNRVRRLFWDIFNELGPKRQTGVELALLVAGVAIPDGPWEEARA